MRIYHVPPQNKSKKDCLWDVLKLLWIMNSKQEKLLKLAHILYDDEDNDEVVQEAIVL